MLNLVSIPEKITYFNLRNKAEYMFPLNDTVVVVVSIKEFINHILKAKKFARKLPYPDVNFGEVDKSYFDKYFNIIKGKESSLLARFLGKELMYRRVLLRAINETFGVIDPFLESLKEKKFTFALDTLEIAKKNIKNIIFNPRKCHAVNITTQDTYLSFFKKMVECFPFEVNSYQFWLDKVEIYNIHSSFNTEVGES